MVEKNRLLMYLCILIKILLLLSVLEYFPLYKKIFPFFTIKLKVQHFVRRNVC